MSIIQANNSEQLQNFLTQNGGTVLVQCHATWCGPCTLISPYVQSECQKKGIPLAKVDIDKSPELSKAYAVGSVPTFVVVRDRWDNIVGKKTGGSNEVVDQMVKLVGVPKKDLKWENWDY